MRSSSLSPFITVRIFEEGSNMQDMPKLKLARWENGVGERYTDPKSCLSIKYGLVMSNF